MGKPNDHRRLHKKNAKEDITRQSPPPLTQSASTDPSSPSSSSTRPSTSTTIPSNLNTIQQQTLRPFAPLHLTLPPSSLKLTFPAFLPRWASLLLKLTVLGLLIHVASVFTPHFASSPPKTTTELKKVDHQGLRSVQPEIHLIGQWYWPAREERLKELIRVLEKNVMNEAIHRIHLIQPDSEFPPPSSPHLSRVWKQSKQKEIPPPSTPLSTQPQPTKQMIKTYFQNLTSHNPNFPFALLLEKLILTTTSSLPPNSRLLASDAFLYASQNLPNTITILANQDIYFDSTLQLLLTHRSEIDLSPSTAYFLSRYEESETAESLSRIGTQCGPKFVGSHDAVVFVPPLPKKLVERTRFELGSWGIEARLLWEFEQVGVEGRNPCEEVKCWHVHLGGVKEGEEGEEGKREGEEGKKKGGGMPVVNGDGKSSIAFPDTLLNPRRPKLVDELWGSRLKKENQ
ncbi:hypothetical protein HDV05_001385 [Chytridiales sp. JEL 0842]|nr:hypothetical protein HDV05_001385 [Chytridiales sp. JEL 0842]